MSPSITKPVGIQPWDYARPGGGGAVWCLFHLSEAGVILRRFVLFGRTLWTRIHRQV